MDRARSRRLLLLAFAISLLLHFFFARFVHGIRPTRGGEEERAARVQITHVQRLPQATPSPTPPPTPQPTPQQKKPSNPHNIATPRRIATNGRGPSGPVVATPQPLLTAPPTPLPQTPAPAATPTPCAGRVIPPQVLQTPAPPPIPPEARAKGTQGVAAIDVTVDAAGQVTATSIHTSSGDSALDDLAAQMARNATYAPATNNCAKVAGVATFTVQFFLL